MAKGGWVYILTNRPKGVLYTGVTSNLNRRMDEHARDDGTSFVGRYKLRLLVHAEEFADIRDAIRREKTLKGWRREWKIALIEAANPDWTDLSGA